MRQTIVFDLHHRIDLTGPWAGFSFLGDRLITPEGRELLPEDLAWLSLTVCQAQEWRRMMEAARVVNLRDVVSQRKQRSAGGDGWSRRRAARGSPAGTEAETQPARVRRFRRGAAPTPGASTSDACKRNSRTLEPDRNLRSTMDHRPGAAY